MKIKMQVQRITVEYSQVLEVDVPSNDDLEAQFVVEEMLNQGLVKFSTRELTQEVDHADYYLPDLEGSDDEHFSEVVQVIQLFKSKRVEYIKAMGTLWSMSIEDWKAQSDEEVCQLYIGFCRNQDLCSDGPRAKKQFMIVS